MTTEKVERTFQVGESFALNFNEIGILATSIEALSILYDYHDTQITQADAMGFDTGYHEKRKDEIRAEQHKLLLKRCSAEHTCLIARKSNDDWLYLDAGGHWTDNPAHAYEYLVNTDSMKRAEKLRAQVLP
jgi:hypothetical protein